MAFFVTWPGADKAHILSTGKSGGRLDFDKQAEHVTAKEKLVTRCGRDVPDEHIATMELSAEQTESYCIACQNTYVR